jgi:hypothetical protein
LDAGIPWKMTALQKSRKAGNGTPPDLDAQFVFLWIAFNALYGTPRYRDDVDGGEVRDFRHFLGTVEGLSGGKVAIGLERILNSPFLNIECWKQWDRRAFAIDSGGSR